MPAKYFVIELTLRLDSLIMVHVTLSAKPVKRHVVCRTSKGWDTRQSAVCWPSYGERIAAQFSTCKSTHVRTDTRPSWPHRARTVTDMFSLNFDGHVRLLRSDCMVTPQRVFPPLSNLWRYELWRCEHSGQIFGAMTCGAVSCGAVSMDPIIYSVVLAL
ncbi:hypothetical protein J6590_072174 [Homalodisca vitripennis]|nr:hypothetical protein J6590_072174 [Homalodisca vitripennis]